jgi:hypothetical protein
MIKLKSFCKGCDNDMMKGIEDLITGNFCVFV